jgi:hypothetical protein
MFEAGKAFDRAAAAYVKGPAGKAAKAYVTAGDLMKAAESIRPRAATSARPR